MNPIELNNIFLLTDAAEHSGRSKGEIPALNADSKANSDVFQHIFAGGIVQYHSEASNEETYARGSPRSLIDIDCFTKQCAEVLDAPSDIPCARYASLGLACVLNMASTEDESFRVLAKRVMDTVSMMQGLQSPGMAVESLARRKGAYLLYELAIQIGQRSEQNKELDPIVLKMVGHWYLRRFIENWKPSPKAIACARDALIRPVGKVSQGWSIALRSQALRRATRDLQVAIVNNQNAARSLGLAIRVIKTARTKDPISVLNRAFRRRVNNLIDYSSRSAVSAAGGYGTQSRNSLRATGRQLRERVLAGETLGMSIALGLISHLPPATLQLVPVAYQDCQRNVDNALVWIDLTAGIFNYRLFRLEESGARPTEESRDCYESALQVVSIPLTPFLKLALQDQLQKIGGAASSVSDLLGPVVHHPRSSIDGGGGYRCTVRRLQESLPAILVQDGLNRWPVSLGTNSPFLVSRGRRAYGACRQCEVDRTVNEAYKLLDWPTVNCAGEGDQLIGSFVTPKASAVTSALNFLATRADYVSEHAENRRESIVEHLNAHAAWMAAFISLAFALRERVTFQLNQGELRSGNAIHFNDKDAHEHDGPPVPIADMAKTVVKAWFNFCQCIAADLDQLGDPESHELAKRIKEHVAGPDCSEPVFTVDAGGRLRGVGSDSWSALLPPSQRLVKNFARHFWPLQLMDRGIEQLLTDVLMRHQITGLCASSSGNSKRRAATEKRLAEAMEIVLRKLCLKLPTGLKSGN